MRTGKKLGKIDLNKLDKLGPKSGLNIKLMMTIGNMVAFVKITVKSIYQFWPLEAGMICTQMQCFEWLKICQTVGKI